MTGGWSRDRVECALGHFEEEEARALRLIWEDAERRREEERTEGMVIVPDAVGTIMSRLGLPSIGLLEELTRRWEELAGPQWGSHAAPIVVRHGELLVEASDRRIVRRLRHDTARLVDRLAEHFGTGFVRKVRVVSPPGRRGW